MTSPNDIPTDWPNAMLTACDTVENWIRTSLRSQRHIPYQGGHDEGTFMACWLMHQMLRPDEEVMTFARFVRDQVADYIRSEFHLGFAPVGEVHHQTEIFTNFLARLWAVDPEDGTAAELLVNAARHVGNWGGGVPWYDETANAFYSWRVGTKEVGQGDQAGFEVPDHFRLVQLLLVAHAVTGETRYIELARRWSAKWANAILQAPEGSPPTILPEKAVQQVDAERHVASGAGHAGEGALARVEPFVGSGAVDVLFDLYEITGDELFLSAAQALCRPLLAALSAPYADPAAALLHRLRLLAPSAAFDAQIRAAVTGLALTVEGTPVMVVSTRDRRAGAGIGTRWDMLRWATVTADGALHPVTIPPPATLMLAFQVTGDPAYATAALSHAAVRLSLAAASLDDGRRHGCGGASVSACAAGHGRSSGYGAVSASLYPLAAGAVKRLGHERAAVAPPGEGGGPPLPRLVRMIPGEKPQILTAS